MGARNIRDAKLRTDSAVTSPTPTGRLVPMLVVLLACTGAAPEPPLPSTPPPDPVEVQAIEVVKPAVRDADRWGRARCNDGTPWGYTVRRGDPKLWVINLQGGFFCDDQRALCSERSGRLTTTMPEEDRASARFKHQGLFSTDAAVNPTFAGATFVDAHYCSSDLWLGDRTERRPNSADPEAGWYFSGRENVRVLLEALPALHGLDPSDPDTRVLLLGTSAGGAGVVGNLDQVATAWSPLRDGRLKVVLDGSWIPKQPEGTPLPDADAWGPVQPACAKALEAAGHDPVECVYGPVWWPHVQMGFPILVQLSGLDKTQTPVFGATTAVEREAWRQRVRADLEVLPWAFSGGHAYHVVAIEPLFAKGPAGRTFRDLLDRFWSDAEPEQVFFRYD